MMIDPVLHTHVEDLLPDSHRLASETVYCQFGGCGMMLHCENNECMTTWVETGKGNFCLKHFTQLLQTQGSLDDDWGLEELKTVWTFYSIIDEARMLAQKILDSKIEDDPTECCRYCGVFQPMNPEQHKEDCIYQMTSILKSHMMNMRVPADYER